MAEYKYNIWQNGVSIKSVIFAWTPTAPFYRFEQKQPGAACKITHDILKIIMGPDYHPRNRAVIKPKQVHQIEILPHLNHSGKNEYVQRQRIKLVRQKRPYKTINKRHN